MYNLDILGEMLKITTFLDRDPQIENHEINLIVHLWNIENVFYEVVGDRERKFQNGNNFKDKTSAL